MALEGQDEEVESGSAGKEGRMSMIERVRREVTGNVYKCFQGNLASHLGGMFSSESQVISQLLA